MEVEEVAANLDKHEAVCAERWKTAFNRFDDIDSNIKRVENILLGAAGSLIVGAIGLILVMAGYDIG
jgi:hypothetical protein|tara:strand:- start:720 stop:920 length:201 start_codon:yes stop_codon:yes gene_type:complete